MVERKGEKIWSHDRPVGVVQAGQFLLQKISEALYELEIAVAKNETFDIYCRAQTSIGLEDAFWFSLKEIAAQEGTPVNQLVNRIDGDRDHGNLSSRLRLFVLDYYMTLAKQKTK